MGLKMWEVIIHGVTIGRYYCIRYASNLLFISAKPQFYPRSQHAGSCPGGHYLNEYSMHVVRI